MLIYLSQATTKLLLSLFADYLGAPQYTCFTSTKVQKLTKLLSSPVTDYL